MAANMTRAKMRRITPPITPPPISGSIGFGRFPAMTSTGTKMKSAAITRATGAR